MVSDVKVSSLYHRRRLLDASVAWTLGLLLYLPFGIVLTVIRLLLVLQLAVFLRLVPKSVPLRRWWFRGIQPGLGLFVTTEGFGKRESDSPKVLVANNVTLLDHCIVESLLPCIAVLHPYRCPVMQTMMGHGRFSFTEGPERLVGRLKKHLEDESSHPVLIHPENCCSTGAGLMPFKEWPFAVDTSVQPILISSSRPMPIAPHFCRSKIIPDLLYFLFVPWTRFHVQALPAMNKREGESNELFSKRVRERMAEGLQVPVCPHTWHDIADDAKRAAQDERSGSRATNSRQPQPNSDGPMSVFSAMPDLSAEDSKVKQVQEVFPNAPYAVVARDLVKTKSVDTTIANILEGRLEIDAPPPEEEEAPGPRKAAKSPAPSKTKPSSTLTFQERKEQLIKEARERFLKRTGGSR